MRTRLVRLSIASVLLLAAWIAMTGSLAWQELIVGTLAAVLVAGFSLNRLQGLDGLRLTPALPLHVLRYLMVFFRALVESNIDMARRVLSPSLPIHPAIVDVDTGLRSPLGRLLLANSITLTPGTLTVEVETERLRVHWIDARDGAQLEAATRAIAARFEDPIRRFLT